jgi:hypothetical protein
VIAVTKCAFPAEGRHILMDFNEMRRRVQSRVSAAFRTIQVCAKDLRRKAAA